MILSKGFTQVILLVLSGICSTSQAKDLLAVGTSFSQIFEQQANGEYTGLGVDILNRFALQQNVNIHYQITPWRRAMAMVERGQADILIGPYYTPERNTNLAFAAEAFYRDDMVFYTRTNNQIVWNGDYASIKTQRIGKMQGWSYGPKFTEQTKSLNINEFVDIKSGIERLSRGDLDLLATNSRNTNAVLANIKISQAITPIMPIIDVRDGFMAFPKQAKFDPLRTRFDSFFDEMIQNGTLTTLGQKYRVTLPH